MLLSIILSSVIIHISAIEIQLSYGEVHQQPDSVKYTISINFNHSNTYLPPQSQSLYLYNKTNVKLNWKSHQKSEIEIGLKYPSDFIIAIIDLYKVKYEEIEFSYKTNILWMKIGEVNLLEIKDIFYNQQYYDFLTMYNFGKSLTIRNEICSIIDGDKIYFNEFLILEILNSMQPENKITYKRSGNKLIISGNINNFPHITLTTHNYRVKLSVMGNEIYLSSGKQNLIGIKTLEQYDKFQIGYNGIHLKKSLVNYQLYAFFALYGIFVIVLTYFCRQQTAYSMAFMRNLFKYVVLKDPAARIQILATELD